MNYFLSLHVKRLDLRHPFTHRDLSILQLASQSDLCRHITSAGEIKLKTIDGYYYQL